MLTLILFVLIPIAVVVIFLRRAWHTWNTTFSLLAVLVPVAMWIGASFLLVDIEAAYGHNNTKAVETSIVSSSENTFTVQFGFGTRGGHVKYFYPIVKTENYTGTIQLPSYTEIKETIGQPKIVEVQHWNNWGVFESAVFNYTAYYLYVPHGTVFKEANIPIFQ
jgi:hypothetical protein